MARKKANATPPAEPESVEPTPEEVMALPYWSRVAFCARVARRLLPLVEHLWEDPVSTPDYRKGRYLAGVKRCVRLVEQAAAKGVVTDEERLDAARGVASEASTWSECAAEEAGRAPGSPAYAPKSAAVVIHTAATAALISCRPDWMCEYGHVLGYAMEAAACVNAGEAVAAAMRADLEALKRLIEAKGWGEQSPVAPKAFGPLWPQGEPAGWPSVSS